MTYIQMAKANVYGHFLILSMTLLLRTGITLREHLSANALHHRLEACATLREQFLNKRT
ncbi:hypothetical protein [Moorena producens]|uniref:hypothetical protein n=1 Tax=Moorena producens TaxID=1155739 RepID=UPI00131454BE|nr:hypothetical protein [Moorena producens]